MKLGVNIDHCATLRQARYKNEQRTCGQEIEPDVLLFALMAERAGADGITMHLREDRRHVQDEDVFRVKQAMQTRLNLEMACTDEMIAFAKEVKPYFVCLVPESRDELTTEGGLDVVGQAERVAHVIEEMEKVGILVSLFIDPDEIQIKTTKELGAPYIELHTGSFANSYYTTSRFMELQRLIKGAQLANSLDLVVNAGHGINFVNIQDIKKIPHIYELNIGHSIISRALFTGVEESVREMKRLIKE